MILAAMIAKDKNALICDFAETYRIYDMDQLPVKTAAVLACGLRDDSRIKLELLGERYSVETLLLAGILDRLSILVWQRTEDGQNGTNRPLSIIEKLSPGKKTEPDEPVVFDSPEEYEAARARIIGG